MNYRVVITANAKSNLREYCKRAAEHAPRPIGSIGSMPLCKPFLAAGRCLLAAENSLVEPEIRQFKLWPASRNLPSPFTIANDEVPQSRDGNSLPDDLTS